MKPPRMTVFALCLLGAAAFAMSTAAPAQEPAKPAAKPAPAKAPTAKPKSAAAKKKHPEAKAKSGSNAHAAVNATEPSLLGQYGDWGAYTAAPGGKKVCFALSKPKSSKSSKSDIQRDQAYVFIATRPSDKVKNEVSVIIGYPLNIKAETTAAVGSASFAMLTQNDGAWLKNAAEEPQFIDAMRKGSDLVVKGTSSRGTQTTDTYSLKGVSQALDRVAKECGGDG
jgi:hypothetical protein